MSGSNFDGGFNKLICEDDLQDEEQPPCTDSNPGKQQAPFPVSLPLSLPKITPERLPAVSLGVVAVVLLIVDISLGAHYNKLTDTHLTTEDIERINTEMINIQDSYKNAIDSMKTSKKNLDEEIGRQKETNWELEHQIKREAEYKDQIEKMKKDIESMKTHLPMLSDGCKHCPPGWLLMNSVCYFFSNPSTGQRTWQKARDFCKIYGGDLAVIDSKEKESATVRILINKQDVSKPLDGFWIGLRDLQEEGTWKWLDGKALVEGYWNDGEPNDHGNEDCAAVYGKENFFKAWNDARCSSTMKWICEKAPTL